MDMRRLVWLVTEKVKLEAVISQNRGHDLDLLPISGIAGNSDIHRERASRLRQGYGGQAFSLGWNFR